MKGLQINENKNFIGRELEIRRLDKIQKQNKAKFIIIYGRRRIGKTELIEQFFRKRVVWKFEGVQTSLKNEIAKKYQIEQALLHLSKYKKNETIRKLKLSKWTDFFEEIDKEAKIEKLVIYFEEIQWLANYQKDFFAELKPYWDNGWRHNPNLTIVICGSSTSFILDNLLSDQALYSRDPHEFHLKELNLVEIQQYLPNIGQREILTAQLTLGGIFGLLNHVNGKGTIFSNLCRESFSSDGALFHEYSRLFVSRMSEHKYYKKVIEVLAKNKFSSIGEIKKIVSPSSPKTGGSFQEILDELENCGLIEKYVPLDKKDDSKLIRYRIADEYLHFYHKFIAPLYKRIKKGTFDSDPSSTLTIESFNKALGFSFERWCLKNERVIAKMLGIHKEKKYRVGSFFNRATQKLYPGFQIDMMYLIEKRKIIFCELKYYTSEVPSSVADEMDNKINRFFQHTKEYKREKITIEKVLITTEGAKRSLELKDYFDEVITFDDLFDPYNWRP